VPAYLKLADCRQHSREGFTVGMWGSNLSGFAKPVQNYAEIVDVGSCENSGATTVFELKVAAIRLWRVIGAPPSLSLLPMPMLRWKPMHPLGPGLARNPATVVKRGR
jgi:hypothetical protein